MNSQPLYLYLIFRFCPVTNVTSPNTTISNFRYDRPVTCSCSIFFDLLYENGHGVRQDMNKAKNLFDKVCDNGLQIGCDKYKELNEKGY